VKLYFRLLWLLLSQSRRSRCDFFGPCSTKFRVFPFDLDIFGHVNNGVYLTLMDLGRIDLMLRSGIFHKVRRAGWYPVVAAETIRFRRSLKLWQSFSIVSSVVGWDDKSFYILQQFVRNDELVAEALVYGRFLARKGRSVPISDLMALVEHAEPSPEIPQWILDWRRSVDGMSETSTLIVQKATGG